MGGCVPHLWFNYFNRKPANRVQHDILADQDKDFHMPPMLNKVADSLRREGLINTVRRSFTHLRWLRSRKEFNREVLALPTAEQRFTRICEGNLWGSEESRSGEGSTMDSTRNLRAELPGLFSKFSIARIFDAPCGDFNWMGVFLQQVDVEYTGGDIVGPLIESLALRHDSERVSFVHLDITRDCFPSADLMICRDCLIHLSYADTRAVLQNFLSAGIPYLLTTTYRNEGRNIDNHDIETGDVRKIDLFSAPYNFPRNALATIDDGTPPHSDKQMCLWSRDQIRDALAVFG